MHHHLRSASLCRSSSRAKVTDATSGKGEPSGKVSEIVDAPVSFLIKCVNVFCFLIQETDIQKKQCADTASVVPYQVWNMSWGTDLSRTIWDLFGQTQSDTKHHVRLRIAWHSEVPESPADGSPTPSCTHIHSNVIASPLITHDDSHFTWYGNTDQTKYDAPVRTAFLDPNNIKVLCKFRVCWKEEIVQVVWKSLNVEEEREAFKEAFKWLLVKEKLLSHFLHLPSLPACSTW